MVSFKKILIICICAKSICFTFANIYGADKIRFGLKSGLDLSTQQAQRQSFGGVFINYNVTPQMAFELEFRNPVVPSEVRVDDSEKLSVFESLRKKEWSTRIALNYFFNRSKQCLKPYIGVGVGNYYSCISKARIKNVKASIAEDNIDYDLRKLLRRPGVFATIGMQYQASQNMMFYMQAKSTLLFEAIESFPVEAESRFSELFNISTGLRFNLN